MATKNYKSKSKSKQIKLPVWLVVIIVLVVVGYYVYVNYFSQKEEVYVDGELTFHFVELGSYYTGDCTLVKVGDTEVLIDAGSKTACIDTVDKYISRYCTDNTLEYVIVTHAHEDHYACFTTNNSLFNRYQIGTIIDFAQITSKKSSEPMYNNYLRERQEAIDSGAKHYTAKECRENKNYTFNLSDEVTMTVLDSYFYYNASTSTENDHSVCTLFTHGDRNFLFTGDLEKKGEDKLVEYNDLPKVKLFKAGHHGSQTSCNNKLLEKIQPEIVCVCCCAGSNEYNASEANKFPSQDFVDRISVYTDKVYVTSIVDDESKKTFKSMNGNIVVVSSSSGVSVNCSNNNTLLKDTDWFKKHRTCARWGVVN